MLGHLAQPDALLLQPDPDSAAGRVPPHLPRLAAGLGRSISSARAVRVPAADGSPPLLAAGADLFLAPAYWGASWLFYAIAPYGIGDTWRHPRRMITRTGPTIALGAEPAFVVQLDAFSGPARPAAASAAGGADRDRRHPDRADRRPVPAGHPRPRAEPGGRLPRDGGPAAAAQGADAAAAPRWTRRAGRIRAPSWCAGCSSTSRSARSRAGWSGPPSGGPSSIPRGYLPPPPELPPPPLTLDLVELLEAVERVDRGDPVAGAAPGGGAAARRRRRHRAGSRRCCDEREEFGWLEALGPRPTIVDVLSTLLALLELARRGVAGAVRLRRHDPADRSRPPHGDLPCR